MWKKRLARWIEVLLAVIDGILSNGTRILFAMFANLVFVFVAGSIFIAFAQKADLASPQTQTALAAAGVAVALAQTIILWMMWDLVDLVDRHPWYEDPADLPKESTTSIEDNRNVA